MFGEIGQRYNKRTEKRDDIKNMINIVNVLIKRSITGNIPIHLRKRILNVCDANVTSIFIILDENKDTIYNYIALIGETQYLRRSLKMLKYQIEKPNFEMVIS
jgi:hypothetical protein